MSETPPLSLLSIEALADVLGIQFDLTELMSFYQQADELGLLERYVVWHAKLSQLYMRAGLDQQPSEYFEMFWHRLFTFHGHYYSEITRRGGNVMEAFLRDELQTFVNRRPSEWHTILEGLVDQSGRRPSCEVIARIHEVCFLPGVLIPYCTETARLWHMAGGVMDDKKKQLQRLQRRIQKEPLLSDALKARMEQEVSLFLAQIEIGLPQVGHFDALKKQLGVDKRDNVAAQKHKIWDVVFKDLVDELRPFCRGPKHFHLATSSTAIPEQAFRVASRLIHLSHPHLWPDRRDLAKNRYYAD